MFGLFGWFLVCFPHLLGRRKMQIYMVITQDSEVLCNAKAIHTFRRQAQASFIVTFHEFQDYKTTTTEGIAQTATQSWQQTTVRVVYRLLNIFHLLISRFSDTS